jgi:hypothetical protein
MQHRTYVFILYEYMFLYIAQKSKLHFLLIKHLWMLMILRQKELPFPFTADLKEKCYHVVWK